MNATNPTFATDYCLKMLSQATDFAEEEKNFGPLRQWIQEMKKALKSEKQSIIVPRRMGYNVRRLGKSKEQRRMKKVDEIPVPAKLLCKEENGLVSSLVEDVSPLVKGDEGGAMRWLKGGVK